MQAGSLPASVVDLDDGADDRVHLVHVDAGPEEPHAEDAHEAQPPRQAKDRQADSVRQRHSGLDITKGAARTALAPQEAS